MNALADLSERKIAIEPLNHGCDHAKAAFKRFRMTLFDRKVHLALRRRACTERPFAR